MLEREDNSVSNLSLSGLLAQTSGTSTTGSSSSSTSTSSSSSSSSTSSSSSLSVSGMDFAKLLVAELKNQDPGKPTDSDALMNQLAMMQMVSEMHSLKTSMSDWASTQSLAGASSMVGRTVTINNGSTTLSGQVSSVAVKSGSMTVLVNGCSYPLSNVTEIK